MPRAVYQAADGHFIAEPHKKHARALFRALLPKLHNETAYGCRSLAGFLGVQLPNARRYLRIWENLGLVVIQRRGRTKFFVPTSVWETYLEHKREVRISEGRNKKEVGRMGSKARRARGKAGAAASSSNDGRETIPC